MPSICKNKTKKTALFRVDASPAIGMGHFMRCRTIALALQNLGWSIVFVGSGLNLLNDFIADFIQFNSKNPTDDLEQLLELVRQIKPACLIIDLYSYTFDEFIKIYNTHDKPYTVVLDDIANRNIIADLILNPNPAANKRIYKNSRAQHIFCGSDYCMIRPEIYPYRQRTYNPEGPLLISLGGSNVKNIIKQIFEVLDFSIQKNIILSVTKNTPLDELNEYISKYKIMVNYDIIKFPELLASVSIAVLSAGITLWEAFTIGVPVVSIAWVDNHQAALSSLLHKKMCFIINLTSKKYDIQPSIENLYFDSLAILPQAIDIVTESSNLSNSLVKQRKIFDIAGAKKVAEFLDQNSYTQG